MAETGARVPLTARSVGYSGVTPGRVVRGGLPQWVGYAEAANHLLGHGGWLIPHGCCDSLLTVGATHTLRWKVFPRYAATRRKWIFTLSSSTAGGRVFGVFTDPSGGTLNYDMGGATSSRYFEHYETISARTSSETELAPTWSVDGASTKSAIVLSVGCVEVPRPELALDTNDYGVSIPSCYPGSEITGGINGYSCGAVAAAANAADTVACRNGLFQFARDTSRALSTTSAVYTPVFSAGADPVLIGRKRTRTSTTATVEVRARCRSDAATTGDLRFTMTSGASLVLSITAAMAATWLTGTLSIDCDDFADDYGRRSARWDKCVIDWRRTGGAGSIYLEGVGILRG